MIHDDATLDAIAVLALGALPEAEARLLTEHLATCPKCRREYVALRQASDLVGVAAELRAGEFDDATAEWLKSRVMNAVRSDVAAAVANAPGVASMSRNGGHASPTRARRLAYAFAVAAALAAMISLGDDVAQRRNNEHRTAQIAELQGRLSAQSTRTLAAESRLARIVAPGTKHFGVAFGEVIASGGRVIVALHDLPALPKGKVYQAWTLARGAKVVAPSITFVPAAAGVTVIELPEAAGALSAVAVSVEPVGGSKKPTSKPTFSRPLS